MDEFKDYYERRFESDKNAPVFLITRKNPCGECAVINGMYQEYSDGLLKQPEPIRTECAKKWHCHKGGRCIGHWNRHLKLAKFNEAAHKKETL